MGGQRGGSGIDLPAACPKWPTKALWNPSRFPKREKNDQRRGGAATCQFEPDATPSRNEVEKANEGRSEDIGLPAAGENGPTTPGLGRKGNPYLVRDSYNPQREALTDLPCLPPPPGPTHLPQNPKPAVLTSSPHPQPRHPPTKINAILTPPDDTNPAQDPVAPTSPF